MKIRIIVENQYNDYPNPSIETSFLNLVYAHGEMENVHRSDLISIATDDIPTDWKMSDLGYIIVKNGIYHCIDYYTNEPCTLFCWRINGTNRGLCVYNSDIENLNYAKEQLLNESIIL